MKWLRSDATNSSDRSKGQHFGADRLLVMRADLNSLGKKNQISTENVHKLVKKLQRASYRVQ